MALSRMDHGPIEDGSWPHRRWNRSTTVTNEVVSLKDILSLSLSLAESILTHTVLQGVLW